MAGNTTPGVITCKAAVAWKQSEPLKVEEIQVEPPKSTEVRIKMLYASMCHTDTTCWKGSLYPMFPRILGHEGVGVIESVGEQVRDLKVGDTVMLLYVGECGRCSNCLSGKTNLCSQFPLTLGLMADGTSRMSAKGQRIYQMFSCSTWSEYAVVESNYVVKVDPRLPLSHASLLTCGFTTGYGGAWKELKVERGSTVAVLGLGAVGLGAAKASKILGASKIIGIDINDMKRDKAKAFGVTDFVNPKHYDKPISQLIQEATGGLGVDYCIECTGVPSLLNEAILSIKSGIGELVLIGAPAEEKAELNYFPLLLGRTIKGTTFVGVRIHSDLPKIVEKCINKEINLGDLITHEVSLADVNKGFMEYMKQPDCVKVIIKF
ncbi:8-hydroxygeraniol oxidoreductase-like [Salvia miltiorrhiza]|uniref:8-hydroxygeraniol oxidoreductase-like n=1 Tax=Salvia miltiorrhiza TaxID=226208 RepID=UPI0025ABB66D|nr:8-hydroxygeraniol oxidoreductase-like [Salvia miltiorrhiza]